MKNNLFPLKKTTMGLFIISLIGLCILCSCDNKEGSFAKVECFENGKTSYELSKNEFDTINEYIKNLIRDFKELESMEKPKSFSYQIILTNTKEIKYEFTGGYLFTNKHIYQIDNYDKVIKDLKVLFK